MIISILVAGFILGVALVYLIIQKKHMHLWLGHYLKRKL